MISGTTRLHETWFQEVKLPIPDFLKNMAVAQLQHSDAKPGADIVWFYVENEFSQNEKSSFGHNLTTGNWMKRGPGHCHWRTLWFLKLVPWGKMLRTTYAPPSDHAWSIPIWSRRPRRRIRTQDSRTRSFCHLGHSFCGWEGVRSTLLTWEPKKSSRNH